MAKTVKIPVSELRLGMYIAELDIPWEETPFLFQGFTVNSHTDIDAVKEHCRYVFIDMSNGVGPKSAKKPQEPLVKSSKSSLFGLFKRQEHASPTQTIQEEIEPARRIYKKTSRLVRTFMDDIRLGISFNVESIKKQVSSCVDSVLRNPDAMMWLTKMRTQNDFIATHCLNVCILTICFGRELGIPRKELENLGLCALLHDVGLLKLSTTLMEQKAPLTKIELTQLQTHTELGRNVLMSASNVYFGVIDVAYTHHEKVNGQGYPRGLAEQQISPFARITSICDTYESMTKHSIYHETRTPFGTLKYLNHEKNKSFDAQLVDKFVDFMGVFPIGSIVELNSGEVGIVISTQRKSPTQPKILVLLDKAKKPMKEKVLDLMALPQRQTEPLKIIRVLQPSDYDIDLEKLQQDGLQIKLI
ncbi:MAG: DUF3391 domain-containing protein [Pseudomonadota bacterium]